MNMNTRQVARSIALGVLFLIPLTPLVVANSFFFPFITGKAFFFRILIEIAVAAWIILAFVDRAYRPRFSWIGAAVFAFVLWMLIADSFAPNAAKAFWSNFERMEGLVLLVHLLGFFAASSSILGVEKKWRAWFLTSLAVSIIVSAYALFQLRGSMEIHQGSTRIDATFGNSAYLAIYLLFNVFIALWLAITSREAWLRWSLIALAALEAVLIIFTETRGTILALVLTLALTALLVALTPSTRARAHTHDIGVMARRYAIGFLALMVILVGGFVMVRNSAFVQNNHVLQRIASMSVSDGQTRFTIWRMAFEGAQERPLTGWGQEGFNYVFNKYYDPSLYTQEPWFDRAHNAFIDWLSAGGLPAFLLYISLFGSALILLWTRQASDLSRAEQIALTGALTGYAIHNMFVFDNLYSYVYFFAILAFIHSQVARPIPQFERMREVSNESGATYAFPIATAVVFIAIWFVNITGMQTAAKLISALSPSQDISKNIVAFEELAARPAFAKQEVREQMVSLAGAIVQSPGATVEQKQRAVVLAVTEMRKQADAYPEDARVRMQLSYAYRAAGDGPNALKEMENAARLSPKKILFYLEKGILEWDLGDTQAAREDFLKAYALGPQFSDLAIYAAAGHAAVGDQAQADALLRKEFGTEHVDSNILAVAYYRAKNWSRLIGMLASRIEKPDANAQAWFGLAAAYYESGDSARAIKTLEAAAARYPDAAASAASAIADIRSKVQKK